MDELLRYLKKLAMRTLLLPLRLLPIKKNRVLLCNDLSRKYADNPKVVCEYLLKHYPGAFEIVFPVAHPEDYDNLREKGIRVVRYNSFDYFRLALTSAVFLTNSGGFSYLPMRKKQFIVNTWHGGGAYKKCGIYMYNNTPIFRKNLMLASKGTKVFMSTCSRFSDVVSESMLIPREIFWEVGMPRNDLMLNMDETHRNAVRKKLGLAEDEKLILFAPTYRKIDDNYFRDSVVIAYGVDYDRVCKAMESRFGGKWRFAVRYHPCVTNRGDIADHGVMDLTDYEDMQDLLCASDAMINDFSSSMWDFMLTGKPSFLFAVDLDHYVKTTKVYTPVSEWPFPQAVNNDQLEENILKFDEEAYAAACKRHYDDLGGCETGKSTQLICERIYEKCFGRKP